ncbi:hypothetical protein PuT2_14250 [Pusillimonas sp. T2]|uniref:hypothetical protein n=1 Tax=Pusillimonas sp. T2 TaxID=1548123 RepID=UPI000B9CED5A|nr:hypothetical protein [Pusillimonas sp. T2]OXR48179.1 hypothetical protein PuT2_14250 [Pusillimonas sp. T2]
MSVQDPVQAMLERMGGTQLQRQYQTHAATIAPRKRLPNAESDIYSYSYCIVVGGLAAVADALLDRMFRAAMDEKHKLLSPNEQQLRENAVQDYLVTESLKPDTGPTMGMDYYEKLNEELRLSDGFKLRPANHRILNHTDREAVIKMLMNGDAGFGGTISGKFPKMTLEQATKLFDLHIAADQGSPQSIPLKFMSWLWEQGVKSANPDAAGASSPVYEFLQKLAPNGDWSGWINKFCEGNPIKSPATLGDAMLKLYELRIINERVFWTSNLGAAVGGFKRRLIITVLMELAVELYAVFEGVRLGHIKWLDDRESLATQILRWRDQPKYVDMKIMIQCMASSYGVLRLAAAQDPLSLNFTSIGMTIKHLVCYPAMINRHYVHLASFSRTDALSIDAAFVARTGVVLPSLNTEEFDKMKAFDKRIIDLGCFSTRVRVLGSRYEAQVEPLIARLEKLALYAQENDAAMALFDSLCESWYLADIEDDNKALAQFESDLDRIEKKIRLTVVKNN